TPPSSLASFSPSSSLRSNRPTFTPWEASRRAVAAPRPEAPPVITAEIDESSFMALVLGFGSCSRRWLGLARGQLIRNGLAYADRASCHESIRARTAGVNRHNLL